MRVIIVTFLICSTLIAIFARTKRERKSDRTAHTVTIVIDNYTPGDTVFIDAGR